MAHMNHSKMCGGQLVGVSFLLSTYIIWAPEIKFRLAAGQPTPLPVKLSCQFYLFLSQVCLELKILLSEFPSAGITGMSHNIQT